MNNSKMKSLLIWAIIFLAILAFYKVSQEPTKTNDKYTYSTFVEAVKQKQITQVKIQGQYLYGQDSSGQKFTIYAPNDPNLLKSLLENGVSVTTEQEKENSLLTSAILSLLPMILLIGVWIYFMRRMQGGNNKAMSFGKSKAKLMSEDSIKVTFADVAGIDEAKEELQEVVEFLSNPKKFTRLGGRIPKGLLLVGPPGTGKTLLAKAVAGEAGVPFFTISGSDFVEMFVGVGASRVRDLFEQAKKSAPCLIFIDEIDAVGRQRGAGLGGGHDEREQTLNAMLVEMDGFESNEGVIILAATNRPDVLDPALLRPGRFDRQVIVPLPDLQGRLRILEVHTQKIPLAEGISLEVIARGTPGFSGADLENLVNEATLIAARSDQDLVTADNFEEAKDKLLMGKARHSMVLTDKEKEITAYHEAGHTLVGKMLIDTDPIHKVTIIPRGRALGVTMQLPESDKYTYSKEYLLNRLKVLFGGRAAEDLIFNQITTGASNDIDRATQLAKQMVCEWGMSETFGPVALGKNGGEVFLGRDLLHHKDYSEETSRMIDQEIKRLVTEAYEDAKKILAENMNSLKAITAALLERETLSGLEIDMVMQGKELAPLPLKKNIANKQEKPNEAKTNIEKTDQSDPSLEA